MSWPEVALFGVFSAYMKNLQLPSWRRGINNKWSSEHSKGPACPPRKQPLPCCPCPVAKVSARQQKARTLLLQQTDFGVQPPPREKRWSKTFCLALQCRTQDFITQDVPQMSPCQKAFPGFTISMPSFYSLLSFLFTVLISQKCFVHNQPPSQV